MILTTSETKRQKLKVANTWTFVLFALFISKPLIVDLFSRQLMEPKLARILLS